MLQKNTDKQQQQTNINATKKKIIFFQRFFFIKKKLDVDDSYDLDSKKRFIFWLHESMK